MRKMTEYYILNMWKVLLSLKNRKTRKYYQLNSFSNSELLFLLEEKTRNSRYKKYPR